VSLDPSFVDWHVFIPFINEDGQDIAIRVYAIVCIHP